MITQGEDDRRPPRLADVAAAVGVSPASASLVMRDAPGPSAETRRRVLEAAERLGYRADRNASLLARRRRNLLGIQMSIRNTFHTELVEDIHIAAERRGYDVVLSTLTRSRDEQQAVETLLGFRCEALLLIGPDAPAKWLHTLGRRLPVIVVGRRAPKADMDVVRTADDVGVGLGVAHLAGLGHRAITFIDGGRGTIAADRRRGYRTAMRRLGLGEQVHVMPGRHTEEAGAAAARRLLAQPDGLPTAIVTSNDRCALGALDTFERADVDVPGRVSIVGYDDSPAAQLARVDLTTVNQNPGRMAEEAVTLAVERLDGGRTTIRDVVLTPHLVVRGTTGAPRR